MSSRELRKRSLRVALLLSSSLLWSAAAFFGASTASAQILVVAPHPDDDVITSAGVIYDARQANVTVWVLYMTNGDYAPGGTSWGLQREAEAVAAQALLGVPEDHLVFLGYPDGSLQSLYAGFFNKAYVPARDGYQPDSAVLAELSNTTYANRGLNGMDYHRFVTGSSATNMGANVQADLVHFLNSRRPTDIYLTGRCDRHPDHTTTFEFVTSALQQLRAGDAAYDPIVHQTIVWAGFNSPPDADDWPLAPNPATYFTEPVRVASCLADNSLLWSQRESLEVPSVMQLTDYDANLKSRAINFHQTQGGFHAFTTRDANDGHISAFVHRDEFFYPLRASGSRPPLDAGTRPPPVDSGTPPPVDSGTPPPADSGTPPPVDSGTPSLDSGALPADAGARLDAGSFDAGSTNLDAGSAPVDAGATNLDAGNDTGVLLDAGIADAAPGAGSEAGNGDAGSGSPQGPAAVGTISAWPGDQGWELNVSDLLHGDAGDRSAGEGDAGCSVGTARGSQASAGFALFGLAVAFLRRRRRRP